MVMMDGAGDDDDADGCWVMDENEDEDDDGTW